MNRDLGLPLPPLAPASDGWAEKRRFPRRQLAVRCWIRDARSTLYARVHDVSLGGLSIRAPIAFAPMAELELAIVLPGDPANPDGLVARARGRVVWVRAQQGDGPGPGVPRMGAEFLDFLDGEQALRRLIGNA
jgi:hypothetical protein